MAIGVYVPVFLISGLFLDHFANKRWEAFRNQHIKQLVVHFEALP